MRSTNSRIRVGMGRGHCLRASRAVLTAGLLLAAAAQAWAVDDYAAMQPATAECLACLEPLQKWLAGDRPSFAQRRVQRYLDTLGEELQAVQADLARNRYTTSTRRRLGKVEQAHQALREHLPPMADPAALASWQTMEIALAELAFLLDPPLFLPVDYRHTPFVMTQNRSEWSRALGYAERRLQQVEQALIADRDFSAGRYERRSRLITAARKGQTNIELMRPWLTTVQLPDPALLQEAIEQRHLAFADLAANLTDPTLVRRLAIADLLLARMESRLLAPHPQPEGER